MEISKLWKSAHITNQSFPPENRWSKIYQHITVYNHHLCVCVRTQSYLTLCDPRDCSPPGSSVHGIFQARIPDWLFTSYSRGSYQSRDQTWVSYIADGFFSLTREPVWDSLYLQQLPLPEHFLQGYVITTHNNHSLQKVHSFRKP